MEDFGCNILIMGKTGVGKSSLLNYLCGQNKALTGTGKPVTGRGFQNYDANINNQTVRIFDSWGLEADKTEEWLKILDTELEHRKVYDNE